MKKELVFVNAQEMQKLHPETFEAPSEKELSEIAVESIVKVSVGAERFWTIVKKVDGENITAIVNNDLVRTDLHGLILDDEIQFKKENVFDIY